MSEPKRYSIVADYQAPWAKMHEFNAGGWVKWEDYARLKAEVERFKFTLEEERQIAREDWAGLRADYARLRSVAEDNKRECEATRIENARLKAEVERLSQPAVIGGYNLSQYIRMANSETLEFDNGDIFADMTLPERIKYIVESHARLKAEVERLTKAGDAMAEELIQEYGREVCLKFGWFKGWNAAKEGKQP
jgi:cell division protein FtsB